MQLVNINKNDNGHFYLESINVNGTLNWIGGPPNTSLTDLTRLCYTLFGQDFTIIRVWGPEKPSDQNLKIAHAIQRLLLRVEAKNDKFGFVMTYRKITGEGLRESVEAYDYIVENPEL